MIEREAAIKIYNEALGAKGAKARLVRVAAEGYYEVTLESQGRNFTTLVADVATTPAGCAARSPAPRPPRPRRG